MSRPRPNSIALAWLIVIVMATTLLDGVGEAKELPSEITIDDALRILRNESPRWAAERAQQALAEADVVAAGVLSNPTLSYNLLQLGQGPTPAPPARTKSRWSSRCCCLASAVSGSMRHKLHSGRCRPTWAHDLPNERAICIAPLSICWAPKRNNAYCTIACKRCSGPKHCARPSAAGIAAI